MKVYIDCLKSLLENKLNIYEHFVPSPHYATVMYEPHPYGVQIDRAEGRYWVFVRLYGLTVYDLSLPKLLHIVKRLGTVYEHIKTLEEQLNRCIEP